MAKYAELSRQIYEALLTIAAVGPKDPMLGICANVIEILGDDAVLNDAVDDALTELFSDWPDKSNSTAYPVGKWSPVPSKLFWAYHDDRRSMWDAKTKYGAARWALLEWCINKLNQGE